MRKIDLSVLEHIILTQIYKKAGDGEFLSSFFIGETICSGDITKLKNRNRIYSERNLGVAARNIKLWKITPEYVERLKAENPDPIDRSECDAFMKAYSSRRRKGLSSPESVQKDNDVVAILDITPHISSNRIKPIGLYDYKMLRLMISMAKGNLSTDMIEVVAIEHDSGGYAIGIKDHNSNNCIVCCPLIRATL